MKVKMLDSKLCLSLSTIDCLRFLSFFYIRINQKIMEALKTGNNILTTSQVIELGFSKTLLSQYVKAGLLIRIHQGLYSLPDLPYDDMYSLSLCSSKIIFSHDTALFLNGLSERTPAKHSLTIPSNSSLPLSFQDDCNCYYIKPELYSLGLTEKKTTFGNTVKCYNLERTVCDLVRSRNKLEEELVIIAIKKYAQANNKDLNLLSIYARRFKVESVIKRYLEVLL